MSVISYGVQSHHLLIARHLEPSSLLNYDVQSRLSQFDIQRCQSSVMVFRPFIFFSLAFKAAISSQLGFQSHVFSLAFRVVSLVWHIEPSCISSVWCLEPPFYHNRAFISTFSAFRATFLTFRAINSIWAFKASSLVFNVISFFSSAFRAMPLVRHSESSYLFQFGV